VNLEGAHSRGAAARAEAERQSEQFKSTLLDGLAHEFKTPLTSIKAAASALLSGSVRDESQQHELLSIVDQEAQRLSELVTEAIHLARIEAGKIQLKREVHSLSELVRSVLKKTAAARNGRTVDLSIPEDLPQTPIDRELIELAIRQLLDNACKYSDRRSPIRIAMTCRDRKIALAVHNWGEGLSEEERLRVFDKFYRARNAQRLTGAGLGLAVAREIFRAHGGDIQVESSPDTGTEFMALLPCVSPEEIRNEFGAHTGS
jgi:two-component system sensor histidine kinase KdpD